MKIRCRIRNNKTKRVNMMKLLQTTFKLTALLSEDYQS